MGTTMAATVGRLTAFLVAVALLAGLVVCVPAAQTLPYRALTADSPLSRVAIVGDSYTNGTDIGGQGANAWPARAVAELARQGVPVTADVAAEGRAGYVVRGDRGSVFGDLTARAVTPGDALVVFFGSRNDQGVDPNALASTVYGALAAARTTAPSARILVIGPPWPTVDVPPAVLQIRDILALQSVIAGATFVDPIAQRWFVDRPELVGRDGVHPTDAGHVYLADKIAPLIRAQLPRPI